MSFHDLHSLPAGRPKLDRLTSGEGTGRPGNGPITAMKDAAGVGNVGNVGGVGGVGCEQ